MTRSLILLGTSALLGLPAAAQEGANMMVPTVPGMFGIDTCGAFLCGSPATVPHGSKRAVHALEAAFRPRMALGVKRASRDGRKEVPGGPVADAGRPVDPLGPGLTLDKP